MLRRSFESTAKWTKKDPLELLSCMRKKDSTLITARRILSSTLRMPCCSAFTDHNSSKVFIGRTDTENKYGQFRTLSTNYSRQKEFSWLQSNKKILLGKSSDFCCRQAR